MASRPPCGRRLRAADAIPVHLIAVNDGDTIEVWVDNRAERVRLVGIDTHEVSGGYRQEECFGPEASRFMKALMAVGGDLWIEQDVEDRDQYGRLLRWVWADFGTGEVYLLNEALLRAGYAERYPTTPTIAICPNSSTPRLSRRSISSGCGAPATCPLRPTPLAAIRRA